MRFLTWCNKIDERSELLFASAKHFGIDVEPIGLGKEYRGGVSKIEWLRDWLRQNLQEDVIWCTDAFDCIWLRSLERTMREYLYGDCGIVVYSGEKWYRKRPPQYQQHFDGLSQSIYRYPNCGCVMGSNIELSGLLESVSIDDNLSEQWHLTGAIAESDDAEIDYDCDLFWCCAGQWKMVPKLAHIENGRLTNLKTGGQPYVFHAPIPGRSRQLRYDIARKLGVPV